MAKLFSYVVEHDHGFAPNPCDGLCTLAKCKYGSHGWKNIIELAEENDWVAGTGGANLKKSAGHEKLIYAMKVDKKLPLGEYCRRYRERIDAEHEVDERSRYSLLSRHFFYFGETLSLFQGGFKILRRRDRRIEASSLTSSLQDLSNGWKVIGKVGFTAHRASLLQRFG